MLGWQDSVAGNVAAREAAVVRAPMLLNLSHVLAVTLARGFIDGEYRQVAAANAALYVSQELACDVRNNFMATPPMASGLWTALDLPENLFCSMQTPSPPPPPPPATPPPPWPPINPGRSTDDFYRVEPAPLHCGDGVSEGSRSLQFVVISFLSLIHI